METKTDLEKLKQGTGDVENRTAALTVDSFETRDEDGKLIFIGYASVFESHSEDLGGFREVIKRGAFRKALDNQDDVRFLINHTGLPLARTKNGTLRLKEDGHGLRVEAELADITASRDLAVLLKRGDIDNMSFAFSMQPDGVDEWHQDEDGQVTRTIYSFGALQDVSPVVYPAYRTTTAGMRSIVHGMQVMDDEGVVDEDALRSIALKIHSGEITATAEERDAMDLAYQKTSSVSPWTAEKALRAIADEPQLRAAVTDSDDETEREDQTLGQEHLAARRLRLRMQQLDL